MISTLISVRSRAGWRMPKSSLNRCLIKMCYLGPQWSQCQARTVQETCKLFQQMPYLNSVSWTVIISCANTIQGCRCLDYIDVLIQSAGQSCRWLNFFHQMPPRYAFTTPWSWLARGKERYRKHLHCQCIFLDCHHFSLPSMGSSRKLKSFQPTQKEGWDFDKMQKNLFNTIYERVLTMGWQKDIRDDGFKLNGTTISSCNRGDL